MRVLIAGCGYVGLETARLFHHKGWEVLGITASALSAEMLNGEPFPVVSWDITSAEVGALGHFDAVVDCVSTRGGEAKDYERIYLHGARNLLAVLHATRFVFTSSTSVYAQKDGEKVSENSPAEPLHETGKILRATEEIVLANGGIVARLAGIYGPGRSMILHKFFQGTARIDGEGRRFLNQIHRDDAARALALLVERGVPGEIYNVTDCEPLRQADCYRLLAEHFHRPMPGSYSPDSTRKRGSSNKQVSNEKLVRLGWECVHRSFIEAVKEEPGLYAE
jgi:nucleoside-diphosphate-sugar epimerase